MTIKKILQSDWFVSLILLGVFLITTGYTYGWDDQHLEIPLLKHLIDPSLYNGDYYVESLQKNFTSFFYPLLAKLITVDQIPAAYLFLYVLSRYFLFFWMYKLWLHISQNKFSAFACVVTFISIVRVQEFLYRTFSHQEFTLAIIFAGIYYFFKNRFFLAAFLLGIAANFHALYSLFPMLYLCLYLLWQVRRHGIKTLLGSGLIFTVCCSPFLYWNISSSMGQVKQVISDWIPLYLKACPQNFMYPPQVPFKTLLAHPDKLFVASHLYVLLILMFFFNLIFNEKFRTNKQAIAFSIGAFLLLIVSLIFTYFHPIRRIVDLNLIRNSQFLLALLSGFTIIFLIDQIKTKNTLVVFFSALIFTLFKYGNMALLYCLGLMTVIAIINLLLSKEKTIFWNIILSVVSLAGIFLCYQLLELFRSAGFAVSVNRYLLLMLTTLTAYLLIYSLFLKKKPNPIYLSIFFIIPLSLHFIQFTHYHYNKAQSIKNEEGFWKLQNNWEDMQKYVAKNTPTEAMLLVPYNMEMGGFRILSERKIIASYRDCGIVGFDYAAALEWERRIKDIEPFKFTQRQINIETIKTAVTKYHASYIVFMSFAAPGENPILERVYANDGFALYKVNGQ